MAKKSPTNVKENLTEMKDVSELILDLSYSAVLFDNKDIAGEVKKLEEEMNQLIYETRVSSILGARNREDAEKLSGILQIAEAAEKISNASGDIAKVVLEEIELPTTFKSHLTRADEVITKEVVKDGVAKNKSLGKLKLESETGLRVIGIRRGEKWIYNPDKHSKLHKDDVVLARGPLEGFEDFYEMLNGEEIEIEIEEIKRGRSCETGEIVTEMKNLCEFATDLAYSAILFYNEDIAEEVKKLEEKMDQMNNELEMWVLRSAKNYEEDELPSLSGLLRIGRASEVVSDAAMEMSDVVLRGIDLHPVFALALRESEDIITRVEVPSKSSVTEKRIGDLSIKTETGMQVVGIRRNSSWVYGPSAQTELKAGDVLIAKGTREGEKRLKKLIKEN